MKTQEIHAAMRERYKAPEWAIFFEVANATGGAASRRADAVAMSVWPSRGLELHGFEVKASRSDWTRERQDPEKAESIFRYMDRWWLVVGDADIVKPGELPSNWGLIVPRGQGLMVKHEAPKLTPATVSRKFLAALLRRAHEVTDLPSVEALGKARDEGFKSGHEVAGSHWKRELGKLEENVKTFEEAAGITIGGWSAGNVGRAVKHVLSMESLRAEPRLRSIRETAAKLVRDADEVLAAETAATS